MKFQGGQDFMMKNIAFSQNVASVVKVEEDGSTSLAQKLAPLDVTIILRPTKYWVCLVLSRQWTALPIQIQPGQR